MTMVHLLKRHKGYQCVLQASEEDGAACQLQFASIMDGLEHHEKPEAVGTGQLGTTLLV